MEFMDVKLLAGERPRRPVVPPFAELRKLPQIAISARLDMIDEPDNVMRLNDLMSKRYGLVPVTRRNPETNFRSRKEFPRRFLFEMTSECNVLCRMCPRNHLLRPTRHIETELYLKGVDEINAYGVDGLWLYYLGESLMHPDFRKIVRYLEGLGNIRTVWFSTNGHLMNESNIKFLLDSRIDFLNYSLNAMTAKTYKSVNPKGNFSIVLDNYRRLIAHKRGRLKTAPFIRLQMVEQKSTEDEVQKFLESYYQDVEVISVNMLEYANLPKNKYGLTQERQRNMPGYCSRLRDNRAIITADGAMTLCDFAYNTSEQHVGEHYLGNIKEQSIYEIWNGDRRRRLLELEAASRLKEVALCRGCTDFDISRVDTSVSAN
jgi:MoaA/NifB/PqqE/SkfB family radical SAM enzyme